MKAKVDTGHGDRAETSANTTMQGMFIWKASGF